MNAWIEKAIDKAKSIYQRAEELTQEEVGIPLSNETVNSLIERYVVQKVAQVDSLAAEIGEHGFHLNARICAKGIEADLSGDFSVITFEFDDKIQRMVFLQKSPTIIESITFDTWYKKPLVNLALLYIRHIQGRDPLGYALEKLGVATTKEDLLYFDIGQYFDDNSSVIKRLKRFNISHAYIKNTRLYLKSRINLTGLFGKKEALITDEDMPENYNEIDIKDAQLIFTDVTPKEHAEKINQYV